MLERFNLMNIVRSSKSIIPAFAFFITSVLTAVHSGDVRAEGREQIHIVGSGTVFPFTAMAAEEFGKAGKFKTPVVEATGTGGGFKLFCEGLGADKADINDASRKITDSEKETCTKNGVTDIAQITIGYDGIILANKKGAAPFDLTKKQIFMALARWLPDKNGKLSANTYQTWNEIDPKLPKQPIEIYGPGTVSGTRDAFAEMVMEKGCEGFTEFARDYPDEKDRKKICHNIREDGKYIELGEDYNVTVQKLATNTDAFGIFGFSFYMQNPDKVQASKIDGVTPEVESIVSGKYGISRGLYLYVKKQNMGIIPGIPEFLTEYTSANAIGPEGYITAKGLIPLKPDALKVSQATVKGLTAK